MCIFLFIHLITLLYIYIIYIYIIYVYNYFEFFLLFKKIIFSKIIFKKNISSSTIEVISLWSEQMCLYSSGFSNQSMNALLQSTELLAVPYGPGAHGDKAHFYEKTQHKNIKSAKCTTYIEILLFEEYSMLLKHSLGTKHVLRSTFRFRNLSFEPCPKINVQQQDIIGILS